MRTMNQRHGRRNVHLLHLAFLCAALLGCFGSAPADAPAVSTNLVRVETATAERRDVTRSIELPASIEAIEQARLYAKVSGYLRAINVDIGDSVSRDQVMAELEIPEMEDQIASAQAQLSQSRAEVAKADAELALQRTLHGRARRLKERSAVTQAELDEAAGKYHVARAAADLARAREAGAEAEVSRLQTLTAYAHIKAPFDGVVTERFVDPGALIQAGSTNVSPLVTVARIDRVRTFVEVPESDVPFIEIDAPAFLEPRASGIGTFAGRVTRFARALDPATRTMRVEADFDNNDGRLYPGMYGNLRIEIEKHPLAVVVPSRAVTRAPDGDTFVYVVQDGVARRRSVRTGIDDGIAAEIASGLQGGEQCIVSASASLADGTPVQSTQAVAVSASTS